MASRPDGDVWNIVDNDKDSQHYGRNFKFDFSYISSKEIKDVVKDYVWQNYRVGNKTISTLYTKLKRKNKPINFETVCKEAGVSRATLYNNAQLKERILSLRAISKASPLDDVVAVKKDKIQLKDDKIASLREQVKKLEDDKKKLIVQLVDYEELKSENERLKKQLAKK